MFPWALFFVLVVMGMIGTAAVIPYGLALSGSKFEDVGMSRSKLIALSVVQSAIFLAVMVGLGLLAAEAVGLELPMLRALVNGEPVLPLLLAVAPLAVVAGALAAALVLVLEISIFRPRMPESIKAKAQNPTAVQGLLASLYGSTNEEIMLRLFGMSAIVWLLSRFNDGVPNDTMFWAAIFLAALLFGLGHLPATARLAPLTPLLVVRGLLLNGLLGLVAGYLYWHYGLEAAMIAHFSADIGLHVLPPLFKRTEQSSGLIQSPNP